MEIVGEFETHVTVRLSDVSDLLTLRNWAAVRNLKLLHIVLERGAMTSQPMLTLRGRGSLSDELRRAEVLQSELEQARFTVSRIKVETAPDVSGVPGSAAEAQQRPTSCYFEHHIKLLLGRAIDQTALAEIAVRHSAHLSRNALCRRNDHLEERFITQRCYRGGRPEAKQQLQSLMEELIPLRHPILRVEEEYVVFDSNLSLDEGWIADE